SRHRTRLRVGTYQIRPPKMVRPGSTRDRAGLQGIPDLLFAFRIPEERENPSEIPRIGEHFSEERPTLRNGRNLRPAALSSHARTHREARRERFLRGRNRAKARR